MSSSAAIKVTGVSKRFRLRHSATRTIKSAVMDVLRHRGRGGRELWALKNIDFEVPQGQTLGIIGANGAGKSTLLALLAGTMTATSGRIETLGTISSLLELGAGFHPDLTGRENIFLAGAIMGLSRRQMTSRLDAIVDFADIGPFLDEPVKHYSSGMYVRLGFAVAVEVDPDILLVDEVLAVGDAVFQRKCLNRMEQFRKMGKTMLIISHDLHTIQSVSDQILFLDHGQIKGHGAPGAVIGQYESFSRSLAGSELRREWGTREVVLTGAEFFDDEGRPRDSFVSGTAVNIRIRYEVCTAVGPSVFGFGISDADGRLVHGSNTQIAGVKVDGLSENGSVMLRLPRFDLAPGSYLFSFSAHSADHRTNYHRLDNAVAIGVESDKRVEGVVFMPSEWRVGGAHGE